MKTKGGSNNATMTTAGGNLLVVKYLHQLYGIVKVMQLH